MKNPYLATYSGRRFYPLAPGLSDIFAEDIAHHLALNNRWNGATVRPYSVAEHSLGVLAVTADIIRDMGGQPSDPENLDLLLGALMHDAPEAYLGDIVSPLKRLQPFEFYGELEDAAMRVISERFGGFWQRLDEDQLAIIHEADMAMRDAEALLLMPRLLPAGHTARDAANRSARKFLEEKRSTEWGAMKLQFHNAFLVLTS